MNALSKELNIASYVGGDDSKIDQKKERFLFKWVKGNVLRAIFKLKQYPFHKKAEWRKWE